MTSLHNTQMSTTDPYDIIPEPMRTIVRASYTRQSRIVRAATGVVLLVSMPVLAYATLFQWSSGAFDWTLAVPALPMLGAAYWFWRSFEMDPNVLALHKAGNRVVSGPSFVKYNGALSLHLEVVHGTFWDRNGKGLTWPLPADAPLDRLVGCVDELTSTLAARP